VDALKNLFLSNSAQFFLTVHITYGEL